MTPPVAPVVPHRPGGSSRVIQGYFRGGQPPRPQPAPPAPARPAAVQPARAPGRPSPVRPSSRPILPDATRPGAVQPFTAARPAAPSPIPPNAPRPATVQPSGGNAFAVPPGFQLRPSALGQRLPEAVQRKMETFFGASFADVRVHVGHEASSIGALAFTIGTDLYFAPGQYNPQTMQGQQLLGHELTHVVQQRAGRVRNPMGSSLAVVQDPALEAEAERMGLRAATAASLVQAKPAHGGDPTGHGPLARSHRPVVDIPRASIGPPMGSMASGDRTTPANRSGMPRSHVPPVMQTSPQRLGRIDHAFVGGRDGVQSSRTFLGGGRPAMCGLPQRGGLAPRCGAIQPSGDVIQLIDWGYLYDAISIVGILSSIITTIGTAAGATGLGWLVPYCIPALGAFVQGIIGIYQAGAVGSERRDQVLQQVTQFVVTVLTGVVAYTQGTGDHTAAAIVTGIVTILMLVFEGLRVYWVDRETLYGWVRNAVASCRQGEGVTLLGASNV